MSSGSLDLGSTFGGGGSGSVTSVALSAPASILTVSGSPVTTSGTLALSLASASGNVFLASPANGSSGALALRTLVAADLPAIAFNKTATWDNRAAGTALATGTKIWWSAPKACTITGWVLLADQSTTSSVTVSKNTYSGWPTENDITGGSLPGISATTKNFSNSLSGWTTSVALGDVLEFSIAANNNAQFLQLFLNMTE